MPAAPSDVSPTASRPPGAEQRFLLRGVPWSAYVALRDAVDHAGVRMTFLEGALELMSPSELHEESKSILGRLLEVWAEHNDVDLRAFGSTTFRRQARERGLEPDECYTLGPKEPDGPPNLAIEVIVESPLLDKLAVYAGLGVGEVWTWRHSEKRIAVQVLRGGRYEAREQSELLPGMDLTVLAGFVRPGESHTVLAKGYRVAIGGKR